MCGELIISLWFLSLGGGTGYVCETLQGGGVPDRAETLWRQQHGQYDHQTL